MSLDIEPLEASASLKIRLGLHIINNVVPRILNDGVYIGERISVAFSWYMFLCKIGLCPNVPKEMEKWGLEEIKIIADELVEYARKLLKDYITV